MTYLLPKPCSVQCNGCNSGKFGNGYVIISDYKNHPIEKHIIFALNINGYDASKIKSAYGVFLYTKELQKA